jgi:hypothetical protein
MFCTPDLFIRFIPAVPLVRIHTPDILDIFWVREKIGIIEVLSETSLYRRPRQLSHLRHPDLYWSPHVFHLRRSDPSFSLETPNLLSKTPSFSLETPRFSLETTVFYLLIRFIPCIGPAVRIPTPATWSGGRNHHFWSAIGDPLWIGDPMTVSYTR